MPKFAFLCSLLLISSAAACGGDDGIDSDTEARWAYLGFDRAIDRALNLGFDGFNAATSANIPTQSGTGDVSGTMDVGGQVDQGASANKEMRLQVTVVDYADGKVDDPDSDATVDLTYDTLDASPVEIDLSLRNIPDGTFTGTIVGSMKITGDNYDATADFDLTLAGDIEAGTNDEVVRSPGTLTVTGTVTSGNGVYDVDTML